MIQRRTLHDASPVLFAVRGNEWKAFAELPGTKAEIATIQKLLSSHLPAAKTTVLEGPIATEEFFKQLAPQQRYLHVATHGFFAPETVKNALNSSSPNDNRLMGIGEDRRPQLVGHHPDLLSGLAFAGANQPTDTAIGDGILSAAEVQQLDLRKVELAVLSACETGVGATAGGEGIIGLQRAFQLAGAKSTVTSLWQVDDAATQALMVEFYRNLLERKLSKIEALRQAQLWLLNNPSAVIEGRDLTVRGTVRPKQPSATEDATRQASRSLPAYWAAFQLSGEWR